MKEKLSNKNLIIVISIFLVVLVFISVIFYINLDKKKREDVEAIVKMVGNNFIIVEDNENEQYTLKVDGDYNVGDKVLFTIENIKDDSYPIEGEIVKINTVSKDISFVIKDEVAEENKDTTSQNNNSNKQEETVVVDKQETNTTTSTTTTTTGTEYDVVSYFENLNNNLDNYTKDKSIGSSLKSGFVTVVDFLFYEGQIKGKTFEELSTSAKIKVLQLAFSIDEKIEKHFPGYKEEISNTSKKVYNKVKTKAIELYLDITTKVCTNDPDTCKAAKEGLSDLKKNFSITWDFIKEISGIGITKLKDWYEVWRVA